VRLRGQKQKISTNVVIQFPFFISSRPRYQYEYSRQVEALRTLNLTAKVKATKRAKHDANTENSTCTVKIYTVDHGDQCTRGTEILTSKIGFAKSGNDY